MNVKLTIILLLLCFQVEAGEWFKTVEISAGVGVEQQSYCDQGNFCDKYDIGPGVIGRFAIKQSIYEHRNIQFSVLWDHFSSIKENYYETPIDFYGLNLSIKHDWH